MDLIRLLRSLEEFLYELIGWFVFYPRTFWRILRHPGEIALYTRLELAKDVDRQFKDTISPVLMLILSVALAHAFELAVEVPLPKVSSPIGQMLFGTEQGLLLTRSAIFCIFALAASLSTLRQEKLPVTRDTLREPFSIQAFLVCPFVILAAIGEQMSRAEPPATQIVGVVVTIAGVLWYIVARATVYRTLYGASWLKALGLVTLFFSATVIAIIATMAILVA